jgi:hypothetical protein
MRSCTVNTFGSSNIDISRSPLHSSFIAQKKSCSLLPCRMARMKYLTTALFLVLVIVSFTMPSCKGGPVGIPDELLISF